MRGRVLETGFGSGAEKETKLLARAMSHRRKRGFRMNEPKSRLA